MNVPAYHIGVLKGYLTGQNAPVEIFVAAEALYMAAIQGPLRADAIEAINLVAKAAEKLLAGTPQEPGVRAVEATIETVEPKEPKQIEHELPAITKRALEMANDRDNNVIVTPSEKTDDLQIADFIKTKGITRCPPAGAAGGENETIAGIEVPKKRKKWSPEARAAAAERMRTRQAAKRLLNGNA